jgi:hypothetical protein
LLQNNCIFPDTIADLFEANANPKNGLIELRVASQVLYKKAYIAWLQNNGVFPIIADHFEAIASPNNGLIELRVAFQVLESLCY